MGLKFRRGTTAQQSGSLAFGEPYVNTTLGTLLIGGPNGDIILSSTGTGSTGNFGAISGSGLDITGNANIAGNLTLGGAITIGDATADTVNVVASLSSSLIPQTTNAFDLGSATKIWKDLYISTGSIKFVEGTTVVKTLNAATLTALEAATGSSNTSITNLNSATASLNTSVSNLNAASSSYETKGRSIVSGSSQIDITSTTGFTTYSTSVDSRITTEKGRVDAILSASSADKDSFAEIVALINSVDTTNDSGFASFYTASVGRLNNLETTSGSVNISVSNLNTFSGSALTRLSALEVETANLETFSSSALTRLDNLEGKDFSITLTGDVTGTGTVTNLSNVSFATTVAANSVALGTDTTGDYVASLVAGTNITLSNNSGEGATPTIGLTNNAITIAGQSTALGSSVTADTIRVAIGTIVTGSSQINLGSATGNIALATQTTGDYVASLVQGTGVTITNNSGENATPTIAIGQSVATNATPTFGNLTINGSINATGDITAYYTSDKRHKNNIQPITNALLKVSKLNGVTWEWNDDVHEVTKSTPKTGLIAQEVQEVLPEVIKEREDGFLALDYSKMMGLLVEAIKEQQIQIEELKAQIGSK